VRAEPKPLRVLVADDHVPTRAGVRDALERGGCTVCAEVGSAEHAIEAALDQRPDACLIDLRMPGNGIRAVAEIATRVQGTSVVVLTVSTDSADLLAALRAGAVGYLLKDMDATRLPDVLRAVVAGEVAVPRRFTAALVDQIWSTERGRRLRDANGRAVDLTPREWQVLELLAEDGSTAEIAARLGVDQVTVRRHVSGLLHKLGVGERSDAVRLLDARRSPT
jgi:two-component system, NarL family, nitrate/nitrite response regulator NarL